MQSTPVGSAKPSRSGPKAPLSVAKLTVQRIVCSTLTPDAGGPRTEPGKTRKLLVAGWSEGKGEYRLASSEGIGSLEGRSSEPAGPAELLMLLRTLDALKAGIALFEPSGAPLHSNEPLRRMLSNGSEGQYVAAEVAEFVSSLPGLARRGGDRGDQTAEELAVREFRSGSENYRVRGSYVALDPENGMFLVALEQLGSDSLHDEALRKRYALTAKQVRVLRLIANGKSNVEIASELYISTHTARHHTEHIMRKLDARSRAEVAAKLSRPAV
jgi:DNA-binding CsgD family transcriptional regulator